MQPYGIDHKHSQDDTKKGDPRKGAHAQRQARQAKKRARRALKAETRALAQEARK